MPTLVLATKLFSPLPHPRLVARPGRVHRLDNDLARFVSHVLAALAGVGLDVDPAVINPLDIAAPEALGVLVTEVTRTVGRAPTVHWVQVLDAYHAIESSQVHETVTFLLEHSPPQLHFVLATRSDPPFPLALLRTRGQLFEIRASDPCFTRAETHDFLGRVMGLDLTVSDVDALDDRTEGWVTDCSWPGSRCAASTTGVTSPPHRGVHWQQPVRRRLPG